MSIRLKAAFVIMAVVLTATATGFLANLFLINSNVNVGLNLIVFSLAFLLTGLLVSIFASPFTALPFEKIEEQSAEILEARKRTGLLLNTVTLSRHLWEKTASGLEQWDKFLDAINSVAAILLKPEIDEFESDLNNCTGMIARAMGIDRIYIWKNHEKDGRMHHTQIYEWLGGAEPQRKRAYTVDLRRCKKLPGWEAALSSGKSINGPVRDLPAEDQILLSSPGIQSVFVLPVFLRDEFRGFIGYDDCRRKKVFTENEQSILSSAGSIIAYAVFQYDAVQNRLNTNPHPAAFDVGLVRQRRTMSAC